jgi:phosphoglycolate phosphatase-like HAD superfamily hydrolase
MNSLSTFFFQTVYSEVNTCQASPTHQDVIDNKQEYNLDSKHKNVLICREGSRRHMAKLVIFDVDGTLVASVKVDTQCFVQSIEDLFAIKNINTRWHTYKNATDSSIFEEIFEKALSRKPTSSEIRMHVEKFTKLLHVRYQQDKNLFKEIPGAQKVLANLKTHPTWKIAIATGGWQKSTVLKLTLAGIDFDRFPLVSASDEKTREDIVRKCINNSMKHYAVNHYDKIVSVGDTTWDIKTAYNLKIGFVGVNKPSVFKYVGRCLSTKDYTDYNTFMTLLEDSMTPDIKSAV